MTFAKGLGHFVIPIGFAIPIGAQVSIDRIWGPEFYTAHDRLFSSLSYFAGAVLLWRIGRWGNSRPVPGEFQVGSVSAHHFFANRHFLGRLARRVSLKTVQRFGFVLAVATLLTGCGRKSADAEGARNMADVVTSADGIPIAYEAYGEGTPALVFVHGWSCDRSYWAGQLQPFSRQFKVVAVDLAGHGESGLGREAWMMGAFGGDVAAVVEKLGLERVILIGHSMGGDVIVEAARRLPGRVAGLVWVDTYKQLGTPRTPEQLQALLAPFRANFVETTRAFVRGMFPPSSDRSLVERVATDMSAAPPGVALGAMESALSFDREIPRALQELNLPVVAINPDYRPTDIASMERYGVEVVVMSGVGHFLMMEDPERFNRLLRAVIDNLVR